MQNRFLFLNMAPENNNDGFSSELLTKQEQLLIRVAFICGKEAKTQQQD